jgi:hypothetical protein
MPNNYEFLLPSIKRWNNVKLQYVCIFMCLDRLVVNYASFMERLKKSNNFFHNEAYNLRDKIHV